MAANSSDQPKHRHHISGVTALLLAIAVLGLSGCVSGRTETTKLISEQNSRLVFTHRYAKQLSSTHFEHNTADSSYKGYRAIWAKGYDIFPHARAKYYELSPGMEFTSGISVSEYVDDLQLKDVVVRKTSNAPIRFGQTKFGRYMTFNAGTANCIAFTRSVNVYYDLNRGQIVGHYCGLPRQILSAEKLLKISNSIEVRAEQIGASSRTVAAAPSTTASPTEHPRLPISVHWPSHGSDVTGVMIQASEPTNGRFWFPMPGSKAECSGDWQRETERAGYISVWQGEFDLLCTNGVVAKGHHEATIDGPSELNGVDTDGYVVSIKVLARE